MKTFFMTLALVLTLGVGLALAVPSGFTCITNNNATSCATGEAQLQYEFFDLGTQVRFDFTNLGPLPSTITQVYFDDNRPVLGAFSGFSYTGNVSFHVGASPSNLPGATNVLPAFSADDAFGRDNPVIKGVDAGETLGLTFDYGNTLGFQDIIDDLSTGALRLGLHVQRFAAGSESFVDVPPITGGGGGGEEPVPEPETLILLGSGLVGLVVVKKRYSKLVA